MKVSLAAGSGWAAIPSLFSFIILFNRCYQMSLELSFLFCITSSGTEVSVESFFNIRSSVCELTSPLDLLPELSTLQSFVLSFLTRSSKSEEENNNCYIQLYFYICQCNINFFLFKLEPCVWCWSSKHSILLLTPEHSLVDLNITTDSVAVKVNVEAEFQFLRVLRVWKILNQGD